MNESTTSDDRKARQKEGNAISRDKQQPPFRCMYWNSSDVSLGTTVLREGAV